MDERLKLTEERKAQLLGRVKEALDDDILDKEDWMKIYDVLVEAHEKRAGEVMEKYLMESINGGDGEC